MRCLVVAELIPNDLLWILFCAQQQQTERHHSLYTSLVTAVQSMKNILQSIFKPIHNSS
jgi:hypothetical protein